MAEKEWAAEVNKMPNRVLIDEVTYLEIKIKLYTKIIANNKRMIQFYKESLAAKDKQIDQLKKDIDALRK